MQNNINIKILNTDLKTFFKLWLEFLKPYHKLRNKEIEVLAYLLYKRHNLKKLISDEKIIDKILLDKENKEEICKEMGYNDMQVLSNMLTSLRKKKVIVDNKIMKGLIPNFDNNNFKLVFNFNINDI